jgi:XTP/dITP diphosphohydrolase
MSIRVTYVTSSEFKREEIEVLAASDWWRLPNGERVGERFSFEVRQVSIKEHLEIDIATLVLAEVTNAYSQLKVPCIVEHAGLIFDKYYDRGYPGGLTKPMWDTLGDDFVTETNSGGSTAHARACVAYCDGMEVHSFTGETRGKIVSTPSGARSFYWDTVFAPDGAPRADMTYAEIVEDPSFGLNSKLQLSQSQKALTAFLEFRSNHPPKLWSE